MNRRPTTIDEYLAGQGAEERAVLEKLRRTIRRIVPRAQECISYGVPAFRVEGTVVAGFSVRAEGFSYLPFSGSTLESLGAELEGWSRTNSALHFTAKRPPPAALLRRLIEVRIAEAEAARASPDRRSPPPKPAPGPKGC